MRKGRRGNGEGYVWRTKDGRYHCQVRVGKKRPVVHGNSQGEMIANRERINHRARRAVSGQKLTLGDWMTRWISSGGEDGRRMSTISRYESIIRNHIIPLAGDVPLWDFTAVRANELLLDLQKALSPDSRKLVRSVLSQGLKAAVIFGKVPDNVVSGVPIPKSGERDYRVFSRDELERFVRAARSSRFWLVYFLMLDLGLRPGEAMGLRWRDLSLERQTATISHTLVKTRQGLLLSPPKTKKSRRKISISKTARSQLLMIPEPERESDFFVHSGALDPLYPDTCRQEFKAILKAAGLPRDAKLHGLRHNHISHSIEEGIDLSEASRRAGHSSIEITNDRYTHLVPGSNDKTPVAMDRIWEKMGLAGHEPIRV